MQFESTTCDICHELDLGENEFTVNQKAHFRSFHLRKIVYIDSIDLTGHCSLNLFGWDFNKCVTLSVDGKCFYTLYEGTDCCKQKYLEIVQEINSKLNQVMFDLYKVGSEKYIDSRKAVECN